MEKLNYSPVRQKFRQEIIDGLLSTPKRMNSKYFYDAEGDRIFQQIMAMPEYYPTKSEMEIFMDQSGSILNVIEDIKSGFDLIELGAGDATKSKYLLKNLFEKEIDFTYVPIDISQNIIAYLNHDLTSAFPRIKLKGIAGEYFEMLKEHNENSFKRKFILFLGSNLGNMSAEASLEFCQQLRSLISVGDLVLMGIDLKKDPNIILDAYNDKTGITKNFNLNLLRRVNRELDGNFDIEKFYHFPTYDPLTGECRSYLLSSEKQEISIGKQLILFKKDEPIFMEISRKFNIDDVENLAKASGFSLQKNFYDKKNYFVDSLWIAE